MIRHCLKLIVTAGNKKQAGNSLPGEARSRKRHRVKLWYDSREYVSWYSSWKVRRVIVKISLYPLKYGAEHSWRNLVILSLKTQKVNVSRWAHDDDAEQARHRLVPNPLISVLLWCCWVFVHSGPYGGGEKGGFGAFFLACVFLK